VEGEAKAGRDGVWHLVEADGAAEDEVLDL
jgi:hypothetical protein